MFKFYIPCGINKFMILYHGSKIDLPIGKSLKTPTGTSIMDVTAGGVVYMADKPGLVRSYGSVYEIEVIDAISYAVQRERQGLAKKQAKYTDGVYVALPENTKILRKL